MLLKTVLTILAIISLTECASVPNSRIVGGGNSEIKKIPYQLSLRNYGSHICGASIISKNWALTAAQCVDGVKDVSSITLVAASNILNGDGHIHEAAEIKVHPKYDIVYKDFDIAVIKVKEAFHIGDEENIISLIDDDSIVNGELCTISGWGFTSQGGTLSDNLKSAQVPIVFLDECKKDYPARDITERDICAGLTDGGNDFCDGDTGGALVCNGKQVGIASWGYGCGLAHLPGVYTSVSAFRSWILEVTNV